MASFPSGSVAAIGLGGGVARMRDVRYLRVGWMGGFVLGME